ncbi:unnamed protein product [Bursaphelenchus okinawaensis]|uniref:Uncharacterized protein n=1 Tax=Bursaphelenchus okinawaensis TaxID=465554 RepID=A0A811KJR4_9BILA|nr:unnamed protein product [Bursaphelenchus okinawaensis]CAG9104358.1 unnamed protein product [Bursaphelenchus okinawaensis]
MASIGRSQSFSGRTDISSPGIYFPVTNCYSYRYYNDYSLHDEYVTDKYRNNTPLFYKPKFPRPHYAVDYKPNHIQYLTTPYQYFSGYRNKTYNYEFPYHKNRSADPYYDSYIRAAYYSPYNLETYDVLLR